METPDIPGICERDIDLLLLEELWVMPEFAACLITHACCEHLASVVAVKKSVTQSRGESDLEVTFSRTEGGQGRLLIENKVDASFQRDQAARYRQRADDYVRNGQCERAWTLVIAPAAYFGSAKENYGFDATLTYEQLKEWYVSAGLGARGAYKVGVLTAAIAKASLGYNPIQDDPVSRFWHDYWEVSVAEAPELGMSRPGPKPAGSNWIYFAPGGLPHGTWLLHKVSTGAIELSIGGTGERLGEVRAILQPILDAGMQVERTGKSSSVRVPVSPLNMAAPLSEQVAAARTCMTAAQQLLQWAVRNRGLLDNLVRES